VKVLAVMLTCHFIADFLLQSREMGKEKSYRFTVLCRHIGIQLAVLTIGLAICGLPIETIIIISGLNASVHGLIDWNIWRGYKLYSQYRITNGIDKHLVKGTILEHTGYKHYKEVPNFTYWDDHWFYVTIGLDQLLHGLTLIALAGLFI